MKQLTVYELYNCLARAIKEGYGDKKVIVADDNEGNSYHGMYYGLTYKEDEVANCLDEEILGATVYDLEEDTNIDELVIIG